MICDPDAFLLIVQKWMADSAMVTLSVVLQASSTEPLAGMRFRGRISLVGATPPAFRFTPEGEGDFVIIHLTKWTLGYADQNAFPSGNPENIDEILTLSHAGTLVSFHTLTTQQSSTP
jgi:hypothetical protein